MILQLREQVNLERPLPVFDRANADLVLPAVEPLRRELVERGLPLRLLVRGRRGGRTPDTPANVGEDVRWLLLGPLGCVQPSSVEPSVT